MVHWSTAADSVCSFNFQVLLKSWSLGPLRTAGQGCLKVERQHAQSFILSSFFIEGKISDTLGSLKLLHGAKQFPVKVIVNTSFSPCYLIEAAAIQHLANLLCSAQKHWRGRGSYISLVKLCSRGSKKPQKDKV